MYRDRAACDRRLVPAFGLVPGLWVPALRPAFAGHSAGMTRRWGCWRRLRSSVWPLTRPTPHPALRATLSRKGRGSFPKSSMSSFSPRGRRCPNGADEGAFPLMARPFLPDARQCVPGSAFISSLEKMAGRSRNCARLSRALSGKNGEMGG